MNKIKEKALETIKIIDVTPKGFNYKFLISTLFAIVSTGLLIKTELKKPKIYGKVISIIMSEKASYSYLDYKKERKLLEGKQYILRLAITCIGKNLPYRDVKVWVTEGNERIKGEIYWVMRDSLIMLDSSGKDKARSVRIPPDQFILFNSVLQTDKVNVLYIRFIVPNRYSSEMYKKLELEFFKPNGRSITTEVSTIDEKQVFFDPSIFSD